MNAAAAHKYKCDSPIYFCCVMGPLPVEEFGPAFFGLSCMYDVLIGDTYPCRHKMAHRLALDISIGTGLLLLCQKA